MQIGTDAAEELFGWQRREVMGKPLPLVPTELLEEARAIEDDVRAGRIVRNREVRWVCRDGARVDLALSVAPLRDAAGAFSGAISILMDISDRKQREYEAARTARFREHLLGIVSHDLRNPLTAIVTSAQLLLRYGELPDRQGRVVARIATSADRMARMIDDLLDFARTRLGGELPIHPRRIDLRQICEQTIEELEFAYTRPVRMEAEGDLWGDWDPDRIAQVISNLAGNALQHSEGDVAVLLRGEPDVVVFQTSNGGPAIPGRCSRTSSSPAAAATPLGRAGPRALHRAADRARARRQHRGEVDRGGRDALHRRAAAQGPARRRGCGSEGCRRGLHARGVPAKAQHARRSRRQRHAAAGAWRFSPSSRSRRSAVQTADTSSATSTAACAHRPSRVAYRPSAGTWNAPQTVSGSAPSTWRDRTPCPTISTARPQRRMPHPTRSGRGFSRRPTRWKTATSATSAQSPVAAPAATAAPAPGDSSSSPRKKSTVSNISRYAAMNVSPKITAALPALRVRAERKDTSRFAESDARSQWLA